MSDLQLCYTGEQLAILKNVVQLAIIEIREDIADKKAINVERFNKCQSVRANRKWYQFWHRIWGFDVLPYEMDEMFSFEQHFRNKACSKLISLQYKLEKLNPTEIVLSEELSNLIVRYGKF